MINVDLKGVSLALETDETSFSPNAVDRGTLAMLSVTEFAETDKVLDLGCGYGIVGLLAARLIGAEQVWLCDINRKAVELTVKNAAANGLSGVTVVKSDGFRNLDTAGFTLILSNPPYHTDFSVAKHFIEKGFNRLAIGGRLLMVTKRRDWYRNKIAAVFGGVKVHEIDGYFVFEAERRGLSYANAKPRGGKK